MDLGGKKINRQSGRPNCLTVIPVLVSLALLVSACALTRPPDMREEAVRAYHYPGLRDEIIVEPPKLSPPTVNPGGKITREIKLTVLSPEKNKKFNVTETTTLSGSGLSIVLSRQESERPQGSHISTIHVTLPKDLPPGLYTLFTTVATEDRQVRQKGDFRVVK
jgi:hypothetical protein